MIYRLSLAIMAFAVSFFISCGPASAQVDHCKTDNGDITCPKERYKLLRDKARVGQLLCEALDTGTLDVALPARLQAVCESASLTSDVWADAQTKARHQRAAQQAQREANMCKGDLTGCRTQRDKLSGKNETLVRKNQNLRLLSYVLAGLAIASAALNTAQAFGVVSLGPR